ncbi:hypothetical protein ACTXT7_015547 [Hymenolepis weldensis]
MSKRACRLPPLYSRLYSFKSTSMPYTTQACQLPAPTPPPIPSVPQSSALSLLSQLLASILLVASLNTLWSNQLLVFCSTIGVSSYSKSHELVTVVAVMFIIVFAVLWALAVIIIITFSSFELYISLDVLEIGTNDPEDLKENTSWLYYRTTWKNDEYQSLIYTRSSCLSIRVMQFRSLPPRKYFDSFKPCQEL